MNTGGGGNIGDAAGKIVGGVAEALIATCCGLFIAVVSLLPFNYLNARAEQGWTMMALIFTVIMVVIALTGSLWVMHHLDVNMMPMSPQDMRQMP